MELVRNYRSTPEVVTAANRLLAGTTSKGVDLVAQRPSGAPVRYTAHPDEVAEAAAAADRIAALRAAGTPAGEMAVLFRINAQSETFEDALTSRGVPYVVRGAARFFDRAEVRQAVTLLRGTARGGQEDGTVPDLVRATLSGMGWSAEAPSTRGETRNRWESLQALVDRSAEFVAELPEATLGDFVDDLDRRAAEQHAPLADGVTLATLHAAKGLEWDAVFLCGLQDGTLPITYADTPAAVEEERRLLYVGMTRARRELSISWALARNPGGRASRKPSRFLEAVAEVERAAAVQAPTKRNRKAMHCRECGAALSTPAEKKTRPLRRLSCLLRRGPLRAVAGVAPRAGRGRQGPGVRRLHRRHPAADRRAPSHRRGRAATHQRSRSVQAHQVRRRRARAGDQGFLKKYS